MFDDDLTKLHYFRRAKGQEALAECYREWLQSYDRSKLDPYNQFMERKLSKSLEYGTEAL